MECSAQIYNYPDRRIAPHLCELEVVEKCLATNAATIGRNAADISMRGETEELLQIFGARRSARASFHLRIAMRPTTSN